MQEIDVGIVADVGTLQRLPKIVGNDSVVRELCYTARRMNADEALSLGLVRFVLICSLLLCCLGSLLNWCIFPKITPG